MKRIILKLGVAALALVTLLTCFSACGADMETVDFNGSEIKYPDDFTVTYNDSSAFVAVKLDSQESIQAVNTSKRLTQEELDTLLKEVEEYGNAFGEKTLDHAVADFEAEFTYGSGVEIEDTTFSLVDPYTIKMFCKCINPADQKVYYATMYSKIFIDEINLTHSRNIIMIIETSSDYSLAKSVLE